MRNILKYKCLLRGSSVAVLFGVSLLIGCAQLKGREDYYTFKAAPETLRQIETIELKKAEERAILGLDKDQAASADLKISLEECRALTLKNNLDLKVQLIEPAIAEERVSEKEAVFEATVSATSSYSNENQPVQSLLEIEGNQVEKISTDLGVSMPLRTGGIINAGLNDYRNESDSTYSRFNPYYQPGFSASITQPLLRNAGKRASTYTIRFEEYNKQITDAQTKQKIIDVIASVDRAYWDLYATRRLLDVRSQQYELTRAMFEQMERLVKLGIRPQIELVRIRASVTSIFGGVINAENDVRNKERVLKRILNKAGLEMKTETVLIPSTEPIPVRYEMDSERMVERALKNRMDLLELKLRIAQDEITIDKRRNETLPSVTMRYEYRMNGLGSSRMDSYDLLFDNKFKDHNVLLFVSMPLGNKAAKSRLRQAKYRRTRTSISRDSKKAEIKKDVLKRIDQLEMDWERILATRQATIHKDQQYQAEKRRFEIGLDTSIDVLRAQTDLAEAQRQEIIALTDYQKSIVDLAVSTGTFLGAAQVQWEPFAPEDRLL